MNPEFHVSLTITTLLALGGFLWRSSAQFTELKTKMDVVWDHLLRRGQAEGVHVGALAMNSPIVLTAEGRAWFAGEIGSALKAWYAARGRGLSDRDLYLGLEREFGERVTKEICIPRGVHAGACLSAAVLFCREE